MRFREIVAEAKAKAKMTKRQKAAARGRRASSRLTKREAGTWWGAVYETAPLFV